MIAKIAKWWRILLHDVTIDRYGSDMSCYPKHYKDNVSVAVYDTEVVDNVTLYKIRIRVDSVSWTLSHRYRDFDELHSKLVSEHGVSRDLLPPKKAIRNKCPRFVEQRRERLDSYLKHVFNYLQLTMPREFAAFLDFNSYDMLFLLQDLAYKFYTEGDRLLIKSNYCEFQPLQVYYVC